MTTTTLPHHWNSIYGETSLTTFSVAAYNKWRRDFRTRKYNWDTHYQRPTEAGMFLALKYSIDPEARRVSACGDGALYQALGYYITTGRCPTATLGKLLAMTGKEMRQLFERVSQTILDGGDWCVVAYVDAIRAYLGR